MRADRRGVVMMVEFYVMLIARLVFEYAETKGLRRTKSQAAEGSSCIVPIDVRKTR